MDEGTKGVHSHPAGGRVEFQGHLEKYLMKIFFLIREIKNDGLGKNLSYLLFLGHLKRRIGTHILVPSYKLLRMRSLRLNKNTPSSWGGQQQVRGRCSECVRRQHRALLLLLLLLLLRLMSL